MKLESIVRSATRAVGSLALLATTSCTIHATRSHLFDGNKPATVNIKEETIYLQSKHSLSVGNYHTDESFFISHNTYDPKTIVQEHIDLTDYKTKTGFASIYGIRTISQTTAFQSINIHLASEKNLRFCFERTKRAVKEGAPVCTDAEIAEATRLLEQAAHTYRSCASVDDYSLSPTINGNLLHYYFIAQPSAPASISLDQKGLSIGLFNRPQTADEQEFMFVGSSKPEKDGALVWDSITRTSYKPKKSKISCLENEDDPSCADAKEVYDVFGPFVHRFFAQRADSYKKTAERTLDELKQTDLSVYSANCSHE